MTTPLHIVKILCGHPHEKSYTYTPAKGFKLSFGGSVNVFGINVEWKYEYTPESMVVDIMDYKCDAAKHNMSKPGEWKYSIDLEVDIKLIKYKYDDGTVSVSEIFLDRRLVIRDIKVTQCQE